ncbi:MAG: heme exporter protein CcmB [Armatimonadetes bacterium]|nr:heme exporter protein CcmB [Anaerolineae bacterium]
MITPFWHAVLTVLRKDIRIELRSRELVSTMALFAALSVFVFSFALELERVLLRAAAGGILWVTVCFALILGLNRSLAAEREQGGMDALLLAPINRSALYVGKLLSNALFGMIVGTALLPLFALLYNVNLVDVRLLGVVALGTLGLAAVGTLLAAMTVQTRAREALLPIVMLPAALPMLILVVRITNAVLNGQPDAQWVGLIPLALLLDALYTGLCYVLFPFVLED